MNVKKGIIALLIFPLFVISMMPLSVHADTTTNTAPFIGVNIQVTGYGENQTSITYPALNINEISANQSSAYIHGQLNCTSPSTPTSSVPCDVFSFANNNGNSSASYGTEIDLNLQNYFLKFNGNATVNGINYFFVDYEFILDDNYKGYVTVTDENSVSKTIYVNGNNFHYQRMQDDLTQHTFTITDYRLIRDNGSLMWAYPMESYTIINQYYALGYTLKNMSAQGNYIYPLFEVTSGSLLLRSMWSTGSDNYKQVAVFGVGKNINDLNGFNNFFTSENITISNFKYLYRKDYPNTNSFTIFKIEFNITSSSNGNYGTIKLKQDMEIIPIFHEYNGKNFPLHITNDFADLFELTNMPSSVSSADQQNDTFKDQSNDLITQEEEFTSNMKQNLQQIDTSFTFNNFGNKFMSSAVWVRDQYDHMITNTPFGTLVTFSMLLGLGLLIIGRTVNK